jgi:trehalose/maltose hydrolase-like predicted phosphorylase
MSGFGGMRREGDTLRFHARLPEAWSNIEFAVCWQGERHRVRLVDGDTTALP